LVLHTHGHSFTFDPVNTTLHIAHTRLSHMHIRRPVSDTVNLLLGDIHGPVIIHVHVSGDTVNVHDLLLHGRGGAVIFYEDVFGFPGDRVHFLLYLTGSPIFRYGHIYFFVLWD